MLSESKFFLCILLDFDDTRVRCCKNMPWSCIQSLCPLSQAGICQSLLSLEHNSLYSWHCLAIARLGFVDGRIVCVLFLCALLPSEWCFFGLFDMISLSSDCQTWIIRMYLQHCSWYVRMSSWLLMDAAAVLQMLAPLIVCWGSWGRFRSMVVLLNPWSLALLLSITILIWMHRLPPMDIGP